MSQSKLALKSFRVEQFKAIQDSNQINLSPLTVLIGYNGSGKSSLLEALETLQGIVSTDLDSALRRWHGIEHIWNKQTTRSQHLSETKQIPRPHHSNPLSFRLQGYDSESQFYQASMFINVDPNGEEIFIQRESVSLKGKKELERNARGEITRRDELSAIVDNGQSAWPGRLKSFINRWQFLLLTPNEMGQPTSRRRTGGAITLNKDGSNIAEYLLDIRNFDLRYGTTAFDSILDRLQYILDYARDLQPALTSELERMVYLQMTEGQAKIPGWLLSSGTLRLVSLLAVLRHPKPPPLIVIEEVENGLDPRTIQLVAKEIKEVVQSGHSQVIFSTHSPSLLDLLDLSNIVLVKRTEQGPTFYPPTNNESLRIWAHKYGLGSLYVTNTLQNFAYEGKESETVRRIETGIRCLIDARLTGKIGIHYWKTGIPGDVKKKVRERIEAHLAKYPFERPANYSQGLKKLNFCDVADYRKIIHYNWPIFEEIFKRKDTLSQHIDHFSELRHPTAHSYVDEINVVQQKLAEAAVIWLEEIIVAFLNQQEADVAIEDE